LSAAAESQKQPLKKVGKSGDKIVKSKDSWSNLGVNSNQTAAQPWEKWGLTHVT
jgi:hypothetical protein